MTKLNRETPRTFTDLRNMLEQTAALHADKDLYVYKENKQEVHYSYGQFSDECEAFGNALHALGIDGEHVAVIGETSAKITVTYFGTVITGGVIVPMDKEVQPEQLVNFLNLAECSAIVYAESFNGVITAAAEKLPHLRFYIPMSGDDDVDDKLPHAPHILPWEDMLALGRQVKAYGENFFRTVPQDLEKMCAILFTSGTTGTSKGVMLSQGNLCAAAYASCMTTPYDSTTRLVSVLPQHHTYEMTCSHLAVVNLGASEYINDSLKYVLRNFASYKPNALVLVPLFVETIYKRIRDEIRKKGMEKKADFGKKLASGLLPFGIDLRSKLFSQITGALGGNVGSIICGGAPISPAILRDFYAFGITIYEGYGITECAPLLACNPPGQKPRFGSVGKPVYGVTIKIDKTEDEETGEILAKGPNVMLGYYKNEAATREVFTEDGWFRTGDVGYIDKDGYIFITGRKKNVIILSNGKNVFPEELEEHLSHSELIRESLVIGRADENGEIAITALIYPDEERLEGKSAEEIESIIKNEVNEINRSLPSFKHMSDVEIMPTEFEKTTSKKIKRFLYQKPISNKK